MGANPGAYTNNYLSIEKEVFLTDAEKLRKDYIKTQAKYYIESLVLEKDYIKSARNYYSSNRDALDFEYLEDIYGMQNPIDLGFTNIIKPRVDALVGISLLSEPDFMVAYTDQETVQAVEAEKFDKLIKDIGADLKNNLSQVNADLNNNPEAQQQDQGTPDPATKKWLEDITAKYGKNYLSSYLIGATHVIRLIETDAEIDLSNIKKQLAKDYFITGEAYTKEIYVGEGKDPKKKAIYPEEIFTNKPLKDRDLKNTSVVVHRERLTPHDVLKRLGDKITKEEAETLFSSYAGLNTMMNLRNAAPDAGMLDVKEAHEMDQMYAKTGWSNGNTGFLLDQLVDFYHVEWLASTKVPDNKGGYVYREDRYECYRVGPELYISPRRCDEAPRRKDTPWKTTLSYNGMINTSPNGVIQSMAANMRELQDLYDIMMFFRNNTVANSGVSGSRVNVAAIPKALGKKFMDRLTKWVTLRKQGLELVDPTEDGAQLFQHYGDFDASVNGNSITAINAILESLLMQADIVSGVSRQTLGIIEERDAVENVKVGINQVSVLALEMFRDVDRCLNRGMQGTLDNFKYAYRNMPLKGVYRNGTAMVPFVVDPSRFSVVDYRVTVTSSGIENSKLLKIQTLAKEFATQGTISPDVLVKIVNNKSIVEIEKLLSDAIAAQKEEMQNMGQMQQQLEEAQKQIGQLEAEIERLNNNKAANEEAKLKLEEKKLANETDYKDRELSLKERIAQNDKSYKDKSLVNDNQVVELEKEQLLFSNTNSTEPNNNNLSVGQ